MVWRPAQQRSLWDSHLPSDQLPISSEEAGPSAQPQQQHGFADTAPFSPRLHSPSQARPAPAAPAPDQAPQAAASAPPADALAAEAAAADAGQAAIPYDWAISIDERGGARVDSEGGRLLVGSGAEPDAEQQPGKEGGEPPPAGAGSSGASSSVGGGGQQPAVRASPGGGPSAGVRLAYKPEANMSTLMAFAQILLCQKDPPHCVFCTVVGSLRGGERAAGAGRVVEGQAAEAIAAMKEARAALGQGPMLSGVSSATINSGKQSVAACMPDFVP